MRSPSFKSAAGRVRPLAEAAFDASATMVVRAVVVGTVLLSALRFCRLNDRTAARRLPSIGGVIFVPWETFRRFLLDDRSFIGQTLIGAANNDMTVLEQEKRWSDSPARQ